MNLRRLLFLRNTIWEVELAGSNDTVTVPGLGVSKATLHLSPVHLKTTGNGFLHADLNRTQWLQGVQC